MARELKGNEDFLQIALIEVPPYGQKPISEDASCTLGKLDDSKEWLIKTPTIILFEDNVRGSWEQEVPGYDTILDKIVSRK